MLVSAKMSNFAAIIHKKTQNRMIKRTATALAALLCIGMTAKAEGYQINTLSLAWDIPARHCTSARKA